MKATSITIHDGQVYQAGEEIHDLGSFTCVEQIGNRRSYSGMSADVEKLPKYDNLATNSSAQCLDTGDFYYYHAPTKSWYKQ